MPVQARCRRAGEHDVCLIVPAAPSPGSRTAAIRETRDAGCGDASRDATRDGEAIRGGGGASRCTFCQGNVAMLAYLFSLTFFSSKSSLQVSPLQSTYVRRTVVRSGNR